MFFKGAIRAGTKGRRTAVFATSMVAVLSVPVIMYSFGANPPLGNTGAPGQGTCASCHGRLTAGSGVTVNAPSSYTPGGAAVSMTVTIPSTGGFELTVEAQSGNAPAGTLAAGPPPPGAAFPQDAVSTQYVYSTVETTSWTFGWTPPATNVGNVVLYVTGGGHSPNYSNSYVIMAPSTTPPPATLAAMPTSLSFTVNGAEPADQTISVTSGGSPIAVTASSATSPAGGTWLTIMPPGGNTPLTETVHIVATGLAAGTYNGSVSFASTGASNSPLSVPVSVNVTTPIPPPTSPPALNLSSTGLTFTTTVGGTAAPQNVMVTTGDGSAVSFSAAPATTSGGSWLSVGALTNTPDSVQISVTLPSGMTAATYHGTVTFTSSAVSNSPMSLPVTLTVNPAGGGGGTTTGGETFSLAVVDRQSGGSTPIKWLLLDGSGSVNSSGTPSGSGYFTIFHFSSRSSSTTTEDSSGTWTPTGVTSYTPVSGSTTGGTLVLQVQITTKGVTTPSTGTLTITSTGSSASVTLAITGGSTFNSVGIGTESITHPSGGGGGGGGGGDDGGGGTTPPTTTPPPTTDN